jgi:hypothetical protein
MRISLSDGVGGNGMMNHEYGRETGVEEED